MCRLRSGAPSLHHTGPLSPRACFAESALVLAASRALVSPARMAAPLSRLADMSSFVNACRTSSGRLGLLARHRRPRTTKYRPSWVAG